MSFNASDVSVIIPSYNSQNTIRACLDSLDRQSADPLEIIVVDSSTDDTARIVTECFPGIILDRVVKRIFPGPARNLGAGLARGEIIAFIDSDCVAEPDWIQRIVTGHNQGYLVVGGAIEVGNPDSPIAWVGHLGEFRDFLPAGPPRHMMHVPTCNISYRRSLFQSSGGFPDAYYPQEDLLFNYMLNRQGIQVWFDPQMRIRHFCREDLRSYLSHQHRIGRVTRSTLRRIDMAGSQVARRAWLAWLLAPLLGMLKFLRTAYAFSANYPRQAVRQPNLFALLALGSIWWARGFAASARTGLSGIRGWDDPDEPIFSRIGQYSISNPLGRASSSAGSAKQK